MPVMEGKAMLFKEFAGIDAYPICLRTQATEEIINTVANLSVGFGGINLEDISAPRCFESSNVCKNGWTFLFFTTISTEPQWSYWRRC